MSLILCIDTAGATATVCISKDAAIVASTTGMEQKNHASFIQPAIQELCTTTGINLPAIDAVAVVAGPGSYTGLRVGLSTAKGLCFALGKPLIMLNTLEVMAHAMIESSKNDAEGGPLAERCLYCPMIDARRMEVFTAVYDNQLCPIIQPAGVILTPESFSDLLNNHHMVFSGNGAPKFRVLTHHARAVFMPLPTLLPSMAMMANQALSDGKMANLAYAEPFYCKEFFTKQKHI